MALLTLELAVHLVSAFRQQEKATDEQDEIPAGDFLVQYVEQRRRKTDYP